MQLFTLNRISLVLYTINTIIESMFESLLERGLERGLQSYWPFPWEALGCWKSLNLGSFDVANLLVKVLPLLADTLITYHRDHHQHYYYCN